MVQLNAFSILPRGEAEAIAETRTRRTRMLRKVPHEFYKISRPLVKANKKKNYRQKFAKKSTICTEILEVHVLETVPVPDRF